MRYLNKIIFMNSAHIPYTEIGLDGNVHFIGTQGVGKSTLLRALLFFYNADKLKLGIPKEKKSFDAFYFPYSNSYIVYEVMRENGAYCVVAVKSQGRVAFRFIDAAFQRDWFIDERNEVYADWNRIRERIGKLHQVSSLIIGYETYRDIIFGNNRRQELLAFRKFAIVESAKYQNIPRTIQNVFLNSKLDADFIKDTIIRSMNDEEMAVDLSFYRSQIKEFEQEYNDVMLWFTKNKNGEIPIRKIADKVINFYRDLIYTHKLIDEERAELNYAEKRVTLEIPQIKEQMAQMDADKERYVRLIGELQEKYAKEHDVLVGDVRVIEADLKKVQEQRRYYERIGIEEMMRRVSQEKFQAEELERVRNMKSELTRSYQDVLSKYRSLEERLEVDFRSFENSRQAVILEKRTVYGKLREEASSYFRQEEERVRSGFEEKLQVAEDKLQQLHDEQVKVEKRQVKLSYEEPYKKEISDCEKSINDLCSKEREQDILIRQCRMEAERLRQECSVVRKERELEVKRQMDDVRRKKLIAEEELSALDALIEKRKGSLAEWLENNKPDWKDTIGRVVDEEAVLYSDALTPCLADDSDTLFGVSLDLSALEHDIRTPEDLRRERLEKQNLVLEYAGHLVRISEDAGAEIERLEKKYSKQIHEITERQHLLEAEQMQFPVKLKNLQADRGIWMKKAEEWKRLRVEELQDALNSLVHRIYGAEEEKKKLLNERERRLKACSKNYKEQEAALQAELKHYVDSVEYEIGVRKQNLELQKQELRRSREQELGGMGADTLTIRKCDDRMEEIKKELAYISDNRSQVTYYERDKKELFDREPLMRSRKKELEDRLAALDERFALRKEKLRLQLKTVEDLLVKVKRELQALEDGLRKVYAFRDDDTFSPPEAMEVVHEKSTRKSCDAIVEDLKSLIVSTIRKTEEFKKVVMVFNGNFSAKNTFNFRTELISEEDYYDFASNLCEFVENDKISDYQKHISRRYTDIIRRISKEVGDLTRNEGEISKTINAINTDFVERNFAGVIKEIALRPLPSSDKLMQLLLEIKRFTDENQHNMGEADLFSQTSREDVNASAVRYLLAFMKNLLEDPGRKQLMLADTFKLEFKVKENDNDTGWVEKIANVGSDGTDILVKAMVNIMLINVFKEKVSHKFGDFKIHCMMDEIGKLHPNNVKGILDFANCRNILLVNSSPTTYNVKEYKYTYLLSKDGASNTKVVPLLTYNKA